MAGGDWITIDRHWCLTEDRKRVVPETDTDARFLHWSPGTVVSREEAERLGAVEPEPEPEPKKTAAPKKAATPANKQMYPSQNKRR